MTGLALARVVDDAGLRDFHGVLAATFGFEFDRLPMDPIEDLRAGLGGRMMGEPIEFWLGTAGSEPVAAVTVRYGDRDNLDVATVAVDVHPDHRRRGYGRAGVDAALARVRELGRPRALAEVPSRTRHADPSAAQELARSIGAKPLHTERRRLLDVAQLDPERLAELIDAARSHATAYSILTWGDRTPPELVDDMAHLLALMSTDPPQGELNLEGEVWDAERYLEHEQSAIDRHRSHLVVAAREDGSGRLAGFTDLTATAGRCEVGYQWSTVVDRAHRGHRLGLLMKAVNLQRLVAELPYVKYLNTWNAEDNPHMVAVNETLGFRAMESWTEWGIEL
jgi:GNAT superfamily N-acetyltransferase